MGQRWAEVLPAAHTGFLQRSVERRCTEMKHTTNVTTASRNNCYPIHSVYVPRETRSLQHSRGDYLGLGLGLKVMLVGYDGIQMVVA